MSQPDPLDAATACALDQFTVPPLSPDFADRVVAKALTRETADALPPLVSPRDPARRGAWARGRRVLIGVTAFSLMSAAAAATGVFGEAAKNVPVIGPLIASVAPAPKPKPRVKAKPKPAADAPALVAAPVAADTDTAPLIAAEPGLGPVLPPAVRQKIRREVVAQRLVDRIERAEALGIQPTPEQRALMVQRLAKLPPQQRVALIKRVREIRRERRAEAGEGSAVQPQAPLLTPEERQQIRSAWQSRREERRQRRLQREGVGSGVADRAGDVTVAPAPENN